MSNVPVVQIRTANMPVDWMGNVPVEQILLETLQIYEQIYSN